MSRLKEFFSPVAGGSVIFLEHCKKDDPYDIIPAGVPNAVITLALENKVRVAIEGMPLRKDELYLVTADLDLDIRDGIFIAASQLRRSPESYRPDYFLARMAASFGRRVIAVLVDHIGLLGAGVVRAEGGIAYIVADPDKTSIADILSFTDGPLWPGQFAGLLSGPLPSILPMNPESEDLRKSQFLLEPQLCQLLDRHVIPRMLKSPKQRGPVRIWIAGPFSAEIACSLSIRLLEHLAGRKLNPGIQIFGSQLNRREVERARIGLFREAALANFTPAQREKYFIKRDDSRYQLNRSIQDLCVFAVHHVVADPPFSHCDLIICPDGVMMLSEYDRDKLFRSFHYALSPNGCLLLLSKAINKAPPPGLFDPVTGIAGLFTRSAETRPFVLPASMSRPPSEAEIEADKILMTGYVPAAMLVDDQLRIVRFYGIVSPYLRRQPDRPSLHLLNIVRDDLIFDLGELLGQVDKTRQPASREGIYLSEDDGPEYRLEVLPVTGNARNNNLVIITEKMHAATPNTENVQSGVSPLQQNVKSLEKKIQKLRYQLQSAHRMFRQTQQELQTANEEMLAINEELQSVNVELQSIVEDLQLRNRELRTAMA